ncbi:MAG: hypothetical protein BMS9Abin28_2329 [Anaerolineae bacterium]|nr:MAG: hypothetical protein BMS9Abin28_2329 [Anaerolineae bacterium]
MIEFLEEFFGSALVPGDPLEAEHGLVMLILLYGLLIYRGLHRRWIPFVVFSGILLSIFTPIHQIQLFWPVVTGLVVPPLLWQAAVNVSMTGPIRRGWGFVIWLSTLVVVVLTLRIIGSYPLPLDLLIGALTLSLVWYFRERLSERTYLSTLGLIALAVLLVEVDLSLQNLQPRLGSLLSGFFIGIVLGFIAIRLSRQRRIMQRAGFFFLGWAYVSYLVGLVLGTSAIASTLAASLVVTTYGFSAGLWNRESVIPQPGNSTAFIVMAAGVWLLLGWQAHTTVEALELLVIPIVVLIITLGILLTRRFAPLQMEDRWPRLVRKETGVILLLLGSLLFWPAEASLSMLELGISLLAGVLLIVLVRVTIRALVDTIGVSPRWPAD